LSANIAEARIFKKSFLRSIYRLKAYLKEEKLAVEGLKDVTVLHVQLEKVAGEINRRRTK